MVATGGAEYSTIIQFTQAGNLRNSETPNFVYSQDGGKTWTQGTWVSPYIPSPTPPVPADIPAKIKAGGVEVEMFPPTSPPPASWGNITTAPSPPSNKESAGGTWLYVRPTAVYMGDTNKIETVQQYVPATATGPLGTPPKADGYFPRDVTVRIDGDDGTTVSYSYSLDDGQTWTTATAPKANQQLSVPGGFLTLDPAGNFFAGQQFVIHPHRADINFDISSNQTVTVNMVGKDIFGGLFQEPFTDHAVPVNGGVNNLFETMGRLIGYAECNDEDGVSRCLKELDECLKVVTTRAAEVGARENRLEVAFDSLTMRELSETDGMSSIENIDSITLMTKLAQQQLAYNTVLKSSSMIMQMSLMNFI
jgi:flagellar hook-associated protein 3 FlgL